MEAESWGECSYACLHSISQNPKRSQITLGIIWWLQFIPGNWGQIYTVSLGVFVHYQWITSWITHPFLIHLWKKREGQLIQCKNGDELAHSKTFCSAMLQGHNYKVQWMGANAPSQNGGIENGTIHLRLWPGYYFMVLVEWKNIILLLSSMPCTSTTVACILPHNQPN